MHWHDRASRRGYRCRDTNGAIRAEAWALAVHEERAALPEFEVLQEPQVSQEPAEFRPSPEFEVLPELVAPPAFVELCPVPMRTSPGVVLL